MAGIDPALPFDASQIVRPPQSLPSHDPVWVRSNFSEKSGDKPRVGLLIPCLNQGGGEAWTLSLIKSTQGVLDWVGVVCLDPAAKANPVMRAAMEEVVPTLFGREEVKELADRCDVLVSWVVEDMKSLLTGEAPPLIWVDHFPHDAMYDEMTRLCLEGVARIVAVSEVCLPGIPPAWKDKTSVLWNAVEPERLISRRKRLAMLASWGVPADAKVAGFYARMALEKRPDAMVRLASHLPSHWHVVLVGESQPYPDEAMYLARMLSQLDPAVRDRIHILPPDHAAGDVLGSLDVLVNPAHIESFGLTMSEALWLGVPVVSTPYGMAKIHPELVYGVDLDAPGATLASAVLEADSLGPRPGSEAFARNHFSEKRFGEEWVSLIREVLGLPPSYPSLPAQLVGFANSFSNHLAGGLSEVSAATLTHRENTCSLCPFFVRSEIRCERCGCNLAIKRTWKTSSCPEGKW